MNLSDFPVYRYQVRARLLDSLRLQDYSGSLLRGIFGNALRRAVCVTRRSTCADCMLYRSCTYAYLYETPPPIDSSKMRRYTAVPHPFVIEAPVGAEQIAAGETLEFALILVGRANALLPLVVHTWMQAFSRGLGKSRSRATLEAVLAARGPDNADFPVYSPEQGLSLPVPQPQSIPPAPDGDFGISLVTPLRLQQDGRIIKPHELRFRPLFSTLLRRIAMLSYFHTDVPLEADFKMLVEAADAVEMIRADLRWQEWTRYSGRQKTTMQFSGIVGSFGLRGDLRPFWPFLYLGQWLHVGKSATFGLGQYTIRL